MEFSHIPVLLHETIEGLAIKENGIYVDGTAGGGGHSSEILKHLTTGKLISIDQDPDAISALTQRFKNNENAVKVFDGDYTFSASGDCVIGLTEPFVYNGGNLIISMESSQAGESGDISFSSDYMDYTASYFHYGTWTDNKHFLPQCTFICADEHKYTVTWKNENGDELEKDENVIGGKMPEYNGSTPTKEQDQQHTYTFDKWYIDQDFKTPFDFVTPITKATTLYAKYNKIIHIIAEESVSYNRYCR